MDTLEGVLELQHGNIQTPVFMPVNKCNSQGLNQRILKKQAHK